MVLPAGEDPVAGTGLKTSGFKERWLPRLPKQFDGRVADPTLLSSRSGRVNTLYRWTTGPSQIELPRFDSTLPAGHDLVRE